MPSPEHDDLYAQLRRRLDEERGPTAWLRALPTPARGALLALTAAATVGALVLLSGVTPTIPSWRWGLGLAVLAIVTFIALATALRPVASAPWPRGSRLSAFAGLALGALGAIVIGSTGGWGAASGLRCLFVAAFVAAPVFAMSLVLDRAAWRGALFAALGAALVGAFAIQLVCPVAELGHLLVGHFGGLVVVTAGLAGIGALVARRA